MMSITPWILMLFVFALWEMVWKGIALWKSGRNNHLGWFIAIFILNTMGILPIIYIVFFQKSVKVQTARKPSKKKRR